jgi:hypothetical protein
MILQSRVLYEIKLWEELQFAQANSMMTSQETDKRQRCLYGGIKDMAIARSPIRPCTKGANEDGLVGGLHLLDLQQQQKEINHIHQQATLTETFQTIKTGAAVVVQEAPMCIVISR